MRIIYVVNSFSAGGAEHHLLVLARSLVSAGHSVLVVALSEIAPGGAKNLANDFVLAGAQITTLNSRSVRWLRDFGRWHALRKTAVAWNPDIIHSHLPRSDLAASLVKRALPKIIWISTIHDAYVKGVYAGYWVFRWIGWNWHLADHIIAVSEHARHWTLDQLGIADSDVTTIYHGVEMPPVRRQSPERQAVGDERPLKIGCLSRFEQRKGIATLIKAMVFVLAKYPTARLVIAGSDPTGYASKMRRLANSLKVGNAIEIQGFCDSPYDFLSQLDVFAFASVSEGFGMVLLEAMVAEIPIVASDIYPLNYIVLDGETGVLAAPTDPESFATAICRMLDDSNFARSMAEAGKKRCSLHFSQKKMLESIHNLYEDFTGVVVSPRLRQL